MTKSYEIKNCESEREYKEKLRATDEIFKKIFYEF